MTRSLARLLNQSPEFAGVLPQAPLQPLNDSQLLGDPFFNPDAAQTVCQFEIAPEWVVLELLRLKSLAPRERD